MPSLKAIRTRIASVKNSRKITRAMKLVAASKLRRAQDAIIAARPYANALARVVSELAEVAGADAHPLFETRPAHKAAVIVFTSDRGLAGAFNANVIKRTELLLRTELADYQEVTLRLIGKKANQYFVRRPQYKIASYDGAPIGATALTVAREAAARAVDDFLAGKVDRVFVVYNEFKSAITQSTMVKQVLPVLPEPVVGGAASKAGSPTSGDNVYEPTKEALLSRLVPLYVQIGLYRAALESIAGEFGARMSAMESATKNAGDMISRLTLQYNRARQAAITKELLEIIGGAEALKG